MIQKLPQSLKNKIKKIPYVHTLYLKTFRFYASYFGKHGYEHWIKNIEPSLWQPQSSDTTLRFSLIVPVYNPPIAFLNAAIQSVFKQTYQNWQLVLVDDASTCPKVKAYLESMAIHPQVEVITHSENQHISQATNTGLAACDGDFVAFLDHDDVLSKHALNEIASLLYDQPDLKWIYSDEDFIDEKGKRLSPHFKSDWNPFLLHAHNYITHLSVYQKDLLIALGGCRVGFEGAQDYDLALRASEKLTRDEISHIPKVLYHWRAHSDSTAQNTEAKSYTVDAGYRALKEHLTAMGINAEILEGHLDNYYDVKYKTTSLPKVSIIIPTRDHQSVLETCVSSILTKTHYPDFEIVIMDNQTQELSAVEYLMALKKHQNIRVISHNKPFNYSEINNAALPHCGGEVLVLLNNDTQVITTSWLEDLVGIAMQPDVGCVGAKLLYPDDTIQHAGVILGLGGYAAHSHRCMKNEHYGYFNRPHVNQALSAVTGACLAIRKSTYLELGGLDETFQVAYNDVDFCLRVRDAGYWNVYCAGVQLYHFESKSRGDDAQCPIKLARFNTEKETLLARWGEKLANDPYYSPHLTRSAEDFSIRHSY